jgi:condensin complex subunit 2
VDDTWSSSFKILENLSRNGSSPDEDEDAAAAGKGSARVGGKSTSSRLGIINTIEKNVDNINATKLESEYTADAMFHKMSQAFDEGGAKGMLMTNLVRMNLHFL